MSTGRFSLGIFDVDDLLLNTSGGLIGFGAIKLYRKFTVNTSGVEQDGDMVEKQKI